MRLEPADLEWMCNAARVPDCWRKAMRLRYVEQLTDEAIAAEMGVRPNSVRAYIADAWKAIRGQGAPAPEVDRLQEQVQQPVSEGKVEHALTVLQAMRGPCRGAAPTPVYDTNGRRAANHDPLVSLGDVLDLLHGDVPELYRVEPWQRRAWGGAGS